MEKISFAKLDEKGCIGPTDLLIEILSPSTVARDYIEKLALYMNVDRYRNIGSFILSIKPSWFLVEGQPGIWKTAY